jgi:galactokinase
MTSEDLAVGLVACGVNRGELPAKRALFDLVLGAFGSRAGHRHPGQYVSWVPGRLEVFGKHTDYAGGRSLVCAVPRGLVVAASRRPGPVHVVDARQKESVTLDNCDPAGDVPAYRYSGWRHYVEVVVRRLARNFPGAPLSAEVAFASDLPRAAGMSSSSALVVGLAAGLVRVAEIDARPEWQANIRTRLDAAGYYACIENGLSFGTLEGDAGVGTHGGSEDHAAIVTGVASHLSAFAFVPMRRLGTVGLPDGWRFVLAPSGVRAEKTGAARDSYNRLARGVALLLELWNRDGSPCASLAAVLESSASAGGRLRDLVRRSAIAGWPPDALERRLDHFIREDSRVPEAIAAFREADRARLSSLAAESQAEAATLLGNQVPATMALARAAREHGALAACSFGAGFGGSVWALVDHSAAGDFAARWHPGAFVADPGPPLVEL